MHVFRSIKTKASIKRGVMYAVKWNIVGLFIIKCVNPVQQMWHAGQGCSWKFSLLVLSKLILGRMMCWICTSALVSGMALIEESAFVIVIPVLPCYDRETLSQLWRKFQKGLFTLTSISDITYSYFKAEIYLKVLMLACRISKRDTVTAASR